MLEQLKQMSLIVVDRLINVGVRHIGSFDVVTLRNKLRQVNWQFVGATELYKNWENPGQNKHRPINHRFSAQYKKGVVTWTISHDTTEIFVLLALHEALGAAGVADASYEISLGLRYLLGVKQEERIRLLQAPWIRKIFSPTQFALAGGFTVIGGGEIAELEIKLALLKDFLKKGVDTHFIYHFLRLKTLPLPYDVPERVVNLFSQIKFVNRKAHYHLRWDQLGLALYLPTFEWKIEMGRKQRNEMSDPMMISPSEILSESAKIIAYLIPFSEHAVLYPANECGQFRLNLTKPIDEPREIPPAIQSLREDFERPSKSLTPAHSAPLFDSPICICHKSILLNVTVSAE